jgi:hypothetical protein
MHVDKTNTYILAHLSVDEHVPDHGYEHVPSNSVNIATVNKEFHQHAPGQGPCCLGPGYASGYSVDVSY